MQPLRIPPAPYFTKKQLVLGCLTHGPVSKGALQHYSSHLYAPSLHLRLLAVSLCFLHSRGSEMFSLSSIRLPQHCLLHILLSITFLYF